MAIEVAVGSALGIVLAGVIWWLDRKLDRRTQQMIERWRARIPEEYRRR